ncbi:porin [Algicola sagamiensis]|uniref:porin n=1 Tax=Algicola sagamiensis TaxID=163869 RepID=UPI000360BCC2|nr:porin [Algicola sagamiensis]
MKKLLALIIPGLLSLGAQAEQYKFEVGGSYTTAEADLSKQDIDTITVDGKFFFEGLKVDNGPRKEAEFLSRASNVRTSYTRNDIENADDEDKFGLGVTYHFRAPVYVAFDLTIDNDNDQNIYDLEAGYYLNKEWTVFADVETVDVDGGDNATNWGIGTKTVKSVSANQWVALEAKYKMLDLDGKGVHDNQWMIGGDFFFNRDLSIGLDITMAGEDVLSTDDKAFAFNATYYVSPQVSLAGTYTTTSNENKGSDFDAFGLGVRARF